LSTTTHSTLFPYTTLFRSIWMAKKIFSGSITVVAVLIVLAAAVRFFGSSAQANAPVGDAAGTYNSKCAKCHGRDGRSKTFWGRRDRKSTRLNSSHRTISYA